MQSAVDVINLALANLANLNFINSLEDDSPEGEQMLSRYDVALQGLLLEHPCGFATRGGVLARMADVDQPFSGLFYAYPNDSLKIRRVVFPDQPGQPLPFSIGQARNGQKAIIVWNEKPALMALWTSKGVTVPTFPPDFASALAWRLAAEIALAKRADPELANAANNAYMQALGKSRLRDAEETGPRPEVPSRWKEARFG